MDNDRWENSNLHERAWRIVQPHFQKTCTKPWLFFMSYRTAARQQSTCLKLSNRPIADALRSYSSRFEGRYGVNMIFNRAQQISMNINSRVKKICYNLPAITPL